MSVFKNIGVKIMQKSLTKQLEKKVLKLNLENNELKQQLQQKTKLLKEHNVIYEMLKNELEDATRKIYKLSVASKMNS